MHSCKTMPASRGLHNLCCGCSGLHKECPGIAGEPCGLQAYQSKTAPGI